MIIFIQNDTKNIIVEFGARRQKFTLNNHRISTGQLLYLIGKKFGVRLDSNSMYTLQMYNKKFNDYYSMNDDLQTFDVCNDIEPLHRFRIINKSQVENSTYSDQILNNIQSTVGKLHSVTKDIGKLQGLLICK